MDHIVEKYMLLVEKVSGTVQMSSHFGTDVPIYRSEIHIIQLIGDHAELYISEISRLIGVTKGTVSQIIKRLEKKGLVTKHPDMQNNTRLIVRLTAEGQVARKNHFQLHKQKHAEMYRFLDTLNAEKKQAIEDFLTHAHDMIETHL